MNAHYEMSHDEIARTRAGFEAMNDGLRQRAVAGMAA